MAKRDGRRVHAMLPKRARRLLPLDTQHGFDDEEVDDQAGGVDKRGDERVGKNRGVDAQLRAHQRHDAADGGGERADAHQGQADDGADAPPVDEAGDGEAEAAEQDAKHRADAGFAEDDFEASRGRTSPSARARVTAVAAWLPVLPPVPMSSGTNTERTTMLAIVSSKPSSTRTVSVAPTASTTQTDPTDPGCLEAHR